MNALKGWISTTCMLAVVMLSTLPVNAGVILGGLSQQPSTPPCTEPTKVDVKDYLGGVIIGGFTGVIIGGFTGVIIGGAFETPSENCGIIYGG